MQFSFITKMSESEDCSLVNVKHRLLEIFSELDNGELNSIEQWICSRSYKKDLEIKKSLQKPEKILIKMGKSLKKLVPFEAEMSSETIVPPTVGDQADCNAVNTCHVDSFLYEQDEVEKLVEKGKIKRHYCLDCNSRNVKSLTYTSHSMSRHALQYIFKVLLPSDLDSKQILDVGSRLGAVIYAAYHLTNASTIFGVEMNKECCEIQEKVISQFGMDNKRIIVVHSDVMDRSDIVQNSNIVIINVLDFFVNTEKHKDMWYFFKKHMKRGSFLISNRSMIETLNYLEIYEEMMDWLTICKPHQIENEIFFDVEECSELFLYKIS